METTPSPSWKKDTILFLSSQAISLFGSSLVSYAILWYITLSTNSGIMLMLSTLFGFLPQLMVGIFAGVWADRFPRKYLIMIADLAIASATFGLAVLFWQGHESYTAIFAVSFIRSLFTGIQTPAVSALLPQIVPKDKLMKVNGINLGVESVMLLLAPPLSALLLSYAGLSLVFFLDVLTALTAVFLLLRLKVSAHAKAREKQTVSYREDLLQGLRYVGKNRFILSLILSRLSVYFLVSPVAMLTPLLVARSYGEEYWRLTLNEVSFFGGHILGGFLIALWPGFKNRTRTFGVALLLLGLLTSGMGLATTFWLYLAFIAVMGLVIPYYHTPITTLLQEVVPEEKLGRVFSLVNASAAMMPLGMLIFGPLSDRVTIEQLLLVCGLLMTLQSILVLRNRHLINYKNQTF